MATTAGVYVEKFNKTIRVNSNGYPTYMLPILEDFVNNEKLEEFVSQKEYHFLTMDEAPEFYANRGYTVVSGVGLAFPVNDSIELYTTVKDSVYIISNDENHEYLILEDGTVRINV